MEIFEVGKKKSSKYDRLRRQLDRVEEELYDLDDNVRRLQKSEHRNLIVCIVAICTAMVSIGASLTVLLK